MKKHLCGYSYIIILFHGVFLSCTEPVDFNQVNDFKIAPVWESSLVYLNQPATSFLVNGNQLSTVQDFIQIDLFKDKYIVDNLIKADFVFETTNSINRAFRVRVDFLDANSRNLHTFSYIVSGSVNNLDVTSSYTEVFQNNTLLALKNTSAVVFTLNMLPGLPINQNSPGKIILKSKGIFFLNVDVYL